MKFPPKEWLLEPIILRKGTVILSGQVKLGKSYLFLSIIKMVVDEGSEVCYFSLEDDDESMNERLRHMNISGQNVFLHNGYSNPLDPSETLKKVEQILIDRPNLKLMCLDTMEKALPPNKNKNDDYREWVEKLAPWNELATKYNVCIVMLHHDVKHGEGKVTDILGSTGIIASFSTIMQMVMGTGDSDQLTLKVTGKRVKTESYRLQKVGYKYDILGIEAVVSVQEKDGDKSKILNYIKINDGCTWTDMNKALPELHNIFRDCEKLKQDGLIEVIDRKYYSLV
jgi:RecA-family ATPase